MIAIARARRFATRPFLVFASLALIGADAASQTQEKGRAGAGLEDRFRQLDRNGEGKLSAEKRLGIGFGLSRETADLVSSLTNENDFVDVMLRRGALDQVKALASGPVKISCVFRSLDQMRETISLLQGAGVKCAYLGYNPEQSPGTPREELDDFVGAVKRAKELASAYGAALLVGPGMRFMTSRESDYAKAAPYADAWLVQSQRFQIDRDTGRRTTPSEYRTNVQRVVRLLRQGNPQIKVWVQIIICPGARPENVFSAEEIVSLARSIEDIVDAARIYTAGAADGVGILKRIIQILRESRPNSAAAAPSSSPASASDSAATDSAKRGGAPPIPETGLKPPGVLPQTNALPKLGVNYVYHGMGKFVRAHGGAPEEYIAHQNEKLRRIGPVWVRSAGKGDRTALHWAAVEPTEGAFDFTLHDARVKDSQGRGLLMLGNVDFSGPPSYARVRGKYFDDAKCLVFLRKIVERYDGDGKDDMPGLTQPIKFWEIGNEPGVHGEFHGTAEDYAHVLRISRESIKANDPDAKILIGGWVIGQLREEETWRRALGLFDRTLVAGGGAWFDIMNYHEYTDDCDFQTYCHVDAFRASLEKHGCEKPFWITEANTKLQKEGKGRYAGVSTRHTVERQAQDLVKRAIVAFDAGVDVFFWHRIDDIKGESLGVGLFDADDQPKPVFYNLQLLAGKLEGFRSIQRIKQMPDSIYLYRLETNAGAELVLWTEAQDTALDLSGYSPADEVEMAYAITEGGKSQPMVRTAPRSSVPATQTPVFIRPIR